MSRVNKSKYVLLLTATIDPTTFKNYLKPELIKNRRQEYLHALKSWIDFCPDSISGIVFCENSDVDLEFMKEEIANHIKDTHHQIEWLSYDGNQRAEGVHYGYAELGIIDYAIENSQLLKNTQYFIKATGRLTFNDIERLLKKLNPPFEFLADCHRYNQDKELPVRMRTQLFIADINFYKDHLFKKRKEMPGLCSHIEEFLMMKIWPLRNKPDILLRFPCECSPTGYSASLGTQYQSIISKIKSTIRGIARVIFPKFWL